MILLLNDKIQLPLILPFINCPAYSYLSQMPPSVKTYGAVRAPQYYNECANCDRIQPELLNAFRANPYTFSLTNAV